MRKSWFGRTAQMIRMGVPHPFEDIEFFDPIEPPPPYVALDHVRHARENGCNKTRSPYWRPVFAEGDQAVTCNDCQRSVWKAEQPNKRRIKRGPQASPKVSRRGKLMPQDIRAGDVMACVDDSPCTCCGIKTLIRAGRLYRVEGIYPWRGLLYLELLGVGATGSHVRGENSARFRKLNDEPDNIELIERIKRRAPVRIPDLPRVTTEVRKLDPAVWGADAIAEGDSR